MSLYDRRFGSDVSVLALYKNKANPKDLTPHDLVQNLVSIFTDCRIRTEVESHAGRATNEGGAHPLPYAFKHSIEIGGVLDEEFDNLLSIFIDKGVGPYWVWCWLTHNNLNAFTLALSFIGRAVIVGVDLNAPMDATTQNIRLEVQGNLFKATI